MENLLAFNTYGLNSQWVEYYFKSIDDKIEYDYFIDINLQIVDVSPEGIGEKDRLVKKKVEDGFNYALDANGNVMKDTAGNDIKIMKYKELSCTVIEKVQEKTVSLKGEIEFVSANPQRIMKKEPIAANTFFRHNSARAVGDIEALSPEDKKLIESEELPFPEDIAMIYDTSEALKNAISDAIRRNRQIIN